MFRHLEIEMAQASVAELARASGEARDFLERAGVDARCVYALDLAIEELVGNILRHGDHGAAVRILLEVEPAEVLLLLEDTSHPFDPTSVPEPPPASSLEEAPVGGRGIAMVRRAVDRFAYRRIDGRNRIEVTVSRRG